MSTNDNGNYFSVKISEQGKRISLYFESDISFVPLRMLNPKSVVHNPKTYLALGFLCECPMSEAVKAPGWVTRGLKYERREPASRGLTMKLVVLRGTEAPSPPSITPVCEKQAIRGSFIMACPIDP